MDFFKRIKDVGKLVGEIIEETRRPNPIKELIWKEGSNWTALTRLVEENRGNPELDSWLSGALEFEEDCDTVKILVKLGANLDIVSAKGRKCLLGHQDYGDEQFEDITADMFAAARSPYFGTSNPERRAPPYWQAMVRTRHNAYFARKRFGHEPPDVCGGGADPTWCADRFGQTLTFLPDGCIVETGGEHEDSYDPDFCIYNDVFVHGPDGSLTIYCYPREVFPPTDFHSATLVGDEIILIGNLGYVNHRKEDHDVVYILSTRDFSIRRQKTTGDGPGRTCRHRAKFRDDGKIDVWGGKLSEPYTDNTSRYVLDPLTFSWSQSD